MSSLFARIREESEPVKLTILYRNVYSWKKQFLHGPAHFGRKRVPPPNYGSKFLGVEMVAHSPKTFDFVVIFFWPVKP